jgi:hypothetical protein
LSGIVSVGPSAARGPGQTNPGYASPALAEPRIIVSLPVHEQPLVVLDQVENLRAFLPPETQVVLHLSQDLGADPAEVAPLLPEGVHVNPTSHPTQWGDIAYLHNDNVRFALRALEPFDHVLLHASNDLYFRQGAAQYIAGAEAGFFTNVVPPDTTWPPGVAAYRDPTVAALLADLGETQIYGGQSEGSFFTTELFIEMLARMDRRYRHGEGEHYVREEVLYPTLAGHLSRGTRAKTVVYSDASNPAATTIGPALIWSLIDGRYGEAGPLTGYDLGQVCAVKRVPRELHHPVRTMLRTIGRATGERLRLAPPLEARRFVALAYASDILEDPSILADWIDAFGSEDAATLAIHIGEQQGALIGDLITAVQAAGGQAPDAPDMTLFTVANGSFEEANLRWSVDAVLRPPGRPAPPFLDDALLVYPGSAANLRAIATIRGVP